MKFLTVVCLLSVVIAASASQGGRLPSSSTLVKSPRGKGQDKSSYVSKKREVKKAFNDRHEDVKVTAQLSDSLGSWRGGTAAVVGGTLTHLALGTLYCWGNFISYLPPGMKFWDGADHPGMVTDATIGIPMILIAQCMTMPLGPLFVGKFGAARTMLVGSLLASFGVYSSSYQKRLGPFLALYALVFGVGAGTAYTAPMTASWKWLPNQKGLASGVILTGFGFGGFLFNILGSKLINPNNANPDASGLFPSEVYDNFGPALRKLGLMYAGLSIAGYLLVTEPKSDVSAKGSGSTQAVGLEVGKALKTPQFWTLWTMIIASASAGLNIASVYKQFAATNSALVGDSYQAALGAMGCIFNGVGRLFWGVLSDKIGFKKCFTLVTVLQAVLHGFLFNNSAGSKVTFMAAICSVYFLLAGHFALMPPTMAKLYGSKRGTLLYGILYSAFGAASIGGMFLSKYLKGNFGWAGSFQFLAAMSAVAAGLTQTLTPIPSLPSSTI